MGTRMEGEEKAKGKFIRESWKHADDTRPFTVELGRTASIVGRTIS